MKKVLSVFLCMMLLLCSCGNEVAEEKVDIPFQKIAACNNRNKLLEKYNYISERTASRENTHSDFNYWIMYFEKNGESKNAVLDYSADYKCYYYNNEIYTEYGDGEIRKVLKYRESYDKIMSDMLARNDTLSYVFILNSTASETEEGFEAEYDFIVNNDILTELEGLGVTTGDKVRVKYKLDKALIIQKCEYYKVGEKHNTMVARIDIKYGEKREFPQNVKNAEIGEKVNINIIEDFGTGSQYSETFQVKKGSYVTENDVLMRYYLFKDPLYSNIFDTASERVEKNTDVFIFDSAFADVLTITREYMEQQAAENEQSVTEENNAEN